MNDPNQERIDAHLDEWDNLSEQEQRFIEDSARRPIYRTFRS